MPHEATDFAEAVATAAGRALTPPDAWHPGVIEDDRCPALSRALAEMGWLELAADPSLVALVAPAALELGRRLAPLCDIDGLLGGSPLVGGLVRYGADRGVELDASGSLAIYAIDEAVPVAYGDAQGVARVLALHAVDAPAPEDAALRTAAWTAATAGYLAGLAEWALETAVEYTKRRRAFGSTLAALGPVQQRLADAATASRGMSLLAHATPGPAALAHAGAAAVDVTAACQQVVGAVGFTLEFPLQRAFRRARAMQLWSDAFVEPGGDRAGGHVAATRAAAVPS
ncbi:MAG TPA: acyl-CoA dehydrogenase family protein [Solirubrobacteraceae bacterium]|nr:acyl-CoA dehydrogenase family protein [Solirubrobacteraceae bacterium]